jgi:ESCRT-II complex subunit VPS25
MENSLNIKNYTFPDYFNWPFFFTIQKHAETRMKQLSMWVDLSLGFCKENKVWRISKSQFFNNLGKNTKINRKLSNEAISLIFDFFVEKNFGIYCNPKTKDEIFILWKSITEWEEFIYAAAAKHQRIETIETLEYIINDEDNINEEFYNMDKDLLILILLNLEKTKRCMLLVDDNSRYIGVKFIK